MQGIVSQGEPDMQCTPHATTHNEKRMDPRL